MKDESRGSEEAAKPECPPLCILKFGSSVLGREEDYPAVALEIYRHVRAGEKVVAVVSALAGETDTLFAEAVRVGGEAAPDIQVARLARIGELRSAALMALALTRIGLSARTFDPHEIGLVAEGAPLDSCLIGLEGGIVREALSKVDVVVVPGFVADHATHGVVTLGRGGTDLSAVFLAARLDAHRVRLIKDVDGVYAEDPATAPGAERYAEMSYAAAEQASRGLIQVKAIHEAEADDVLIEIASLGSAHATRIGNFPILKSTPMPRRRLRVSLLGCGVVGGGVLAYLHSCRELFEIGPALVRRPELHHEPAFFTSDPAEALAFGPDIVVETLCGADLPAELMRRALLDGAEVVSANKAAVAGHWEALHASAERGGGRLRYSAAVGGGTPILETVRRLNGVVVAIEGVMSGTCNYLLCRLAEGCNLDRALGEARELGLAEANPSADLDGMDAAAKLSILAREAFGKFVDPTRISRESLDERSVQAALAAAARGETLKQVGSCWLLEDGSVETDVRLRSLPASHPLAGASDEANCFLVTDVGGKAHQVRGKGAGRWPTAACVFADIMDARQSLLERELMSSKAVKRRA